MINFVRKNPIFKKPLDVSKTYIIQTQFNLIIRYDLYFKFIFEKSNNLQNYISF